MRTPLLPTLLSLICAADLAVAGAYRWVDEGGRVQYSDRPVPGALAVPLPVSKVPEASESRPQPLADADPGPYTAFEITSPEPNATVRDPGGRVPIALLLDPPLLPGHRLQVLLNGQPIPGETPGMHLALEGLPFGSHRLRVEVLDDRGTPVASTATVDFHLRRPLLETERP